MASLWAGKKLTASWSNKTTPAALQTLCLKGSFSLGDDCLLLLFWIASPRADVTSSPGPEATADSAIERPLHPCLNVGNEHVEYRRHC